MFPLVEPASCYYQGDDRVGLDVLLVFQRPFSPAGAVLHYRFFVASRWIAADFALPPSRPTFDAGRGSPTRSPRTARRLPPPTPPALCTSARFAIAARTTSKCSPNARSRSGFDAAAQVDRLAAAPCLARIPSSLVNAGTARPRRSPRRSSGVARAQARQLAGHGGDRIAPAGPAVPGPSHRPRRGVGTRDRGMGGATGRACRRR